LKTAIDTNILVYSLNKSSKYHDICRQFLLSGLENPVVPNQTLFEFLRVVTHSKYPHPLDIKAAINHVAIYKSLYETIYETEQDFQVFRDLYLKYKLGSNRVFDTKLVATLINNGINRLATMNDKDFKIFSEIETVSPLVL
jgi:predicted nucleic acid-binding protein